MAAQTPSPSDEPKRTIATNANKRRRNRRVGESSNRRALTQCQASGSAWSDEAWRILSQRRNETTVQMSSTTPNGHAPWRKP